MKRGRFLAAAVMLPAGLAMGWWYFHWCRRAALFWGAGADATVFIALAAALAGLALIFIKPIPIKASTVAAMYMLLFGLLAEGALSAAGLLSPFFIRLRDCGAVPAALSAAGIIYGRVHSKKTVLTRYGITSPRAVSPLRIALVSDVHMGLSVDESRLRSAADAISAEKPDLLIIAGDLVDDRTTAEEMEAACRILGGVKTAYGSWFVYGNHDMAARGPKLAFSPERYREALAENGISILDDKCVRLEGAATLAGRLDAWGDQRLEAERLLEGADAELPVILIDHQPRDISGAVRAGATLQLSGHTHGGQVWPAGALSALLQPKSVVCGHRLVEGCHVIVSSGLGTRGSRLRSGCTAEAVLIELLPEKGQK